MYLLLNETNCFAKKFIIYVRVVVIATLPQSLKLGYCFSRNLYKRTQYNTLLFFALFYNSTGFLFVINKTNGIDFF